MKVWAISDTHTRHENLVVPEGIDMVIHAGDASIARSVSQNREQMVPFLEWYSSLDIKYKVLIAGNHDTSVQVRRTMQIPLEIPDNIIYLQHEMREIAGVKIFGSPYTPTFGHGWAFNVDRPDLLGKWGEIPEDCDILVTHGPPKGILDMTQYDSRQPGNNGKVFQQCGCEHLLNRIKEIQPKYSIFGHIHNEENCQNSGVLRLSNIETTFINASIVDLKYNPHNNGWVFDYV